MKLKVLMERPTEEYTRESFTQEFDVSDFKVERGCLFLFRQEASRPWRVFNCTEWCEIAVDEDELILYTDPKKPSGPATTGKVVPITRKE
jgi:hypothetical protein